MTLIYLDYAATTPVHPAVMAAMAPYWTANFGNPSSIHRVGRAAAAGVDTARDQVARVLQCRPSEVVFTSGATEADNLAIVGTVTASSLDQPHIITTVIEHPAVRETCRALVKAGRATVSWIGVGADGLVNPAAVMAAITDETILVSVMYANNEIGTIQPIAKIGAALAKINSGRATKIIFHTDAAQAAAYLDLTVDRLGVDLLSLSSHKIYGPKGVGALYVRANISVHTLMHGGEQEYNLRPGTVPVPLVVGFGQAVEHSRRVDWREAVARIGGLRDELISQLQSQIPGAHLNGSLIERLPNNVNIAIDGISGETLAIKLDMAGLAISTGSACAAGRLEPSATLQALGLSPAAVAASIRLTLGEPTTAGEVTAAVKLLAAVLINSR